jgi:hypothetical protein
MSPENNLGAAYLTALKKPRLQTLEQLGCVMKIELAASNL